MRYAILLCSVTLAACGEAERTDVFIIDGGSGATCDAKHACDDCDPCTHDEVSAGECIHLQLSPASGCGALADVDASDAANGCKSAADCTVDSPCKDPVCDAGVCGWEPACEIVSTCAGQPDGAPCLNGFGECDNEECHPFSPHP